MFSLSGYNELFTMNNLLFTFPLDSVCENLSLFKITFFWWCALKSKERRVGLSCFYYANSTKLGNGLNLC